MVGDPGCAICWVPSLYADEDEKPLDDGKEGETTKEKSNDESASSLTSECTSLTRASSINAHTHNPRYLLSTSSPP